MDAVVKIGGSLQEYPRVLKKVCDVLAKISENHHLLIVPGGGKFADLVRELQSEYGFSDRIAHPMAILGMDAYGFTLHHLIPNSILINDLGRVGFKGCQIFLPYRTVIECEDLEPSWEATSDAIAAWVSAKIACKKLILIKMVDGIFERGKIQISVSSKRLKKMDQSVVDQKIPDILERAGITCWIVNGKYPERVENILKNKKTICTKISPCR